MSALLSASGAGVAVLGAILYLVLNLTCSAVYEPLGVDPAAVGLDYGNLLAQSAVAVAALTIIAACRRRVAHRGAVLP